jgi:hypothetical protein
VSLALGVEQFIGLGIALGTLTGIVDAHIVGPPRSISQFYVFSAGLMVLGQTLQLRLYRSTDNGASYNQIAVATIPGGQRTANNSFGPVALSTGDLLAIGVRVNGLLYVGGVSASAF